MSVVKDIYIDDVYILGSIPILLYNKQFSENIYGM
jgi:hypothetical protein